MKSVPAFLALAVSLLLACGPAFAGSISGSKSCEKLALEDALKLEKEKASICRDADPKVSRKTMQNITYVVVHPMAPWGSYQCGQDEDYYYKIDSESAAGCTLSWTE